MGFARQNLQTPTPLSNLSIKLANDAAVFQARNLFVRKGVNKGTGKIRVYSADNLRIEGGPAGRRSVAAEIERSYSLMGYETKEEALRELILDKDVRDADDDIANMRLDSVQDLTEKHLLKLEQAAITKAFTAANFATGHSSALAKTWADDTSDPVEDVKLGIERIRMSLAGRKPDTLAIDEKTWQALKDHPAILDRVKYVAPGVAVVRQDTVAQIFDINSIIIIGAVYNSSNVGENATLAPILSGKGLLFYKGQTEGLRTVGFGSMLVPPGGDFRTKTYRPQEVEGEFVEVRAEYALQFHAVDSVASGKSIGGYLMTGTV